MKRPSRKSDQEEKREFSGGTSPGKNPTAGWGKQSGCGKGSIHALKASMRKNHRERIMGKNPKKEE